MSLRVWSPSSSSSLVLEGVEERLVDALLDTILAHGAASQDMLQVNHQTCTQPQQVFSFCNLKGLEK